MGSEEATKARARGGAYRLRTEARDVHPIVRQLTLRRQQLDLSQTEVANRMGLVSAQSVYALEAGLSNPTLTSLDRWARALGMTLGVDDGAPS